MIISAIERQCKRTFFCSFALKYVYFVLIIIYGKNGEISYFLVRFNIFCSFALTYVYLYYIIMGKMLKLVI